MADEVADTALGNGLAMTDPITLYDHDGQTILATFSHPLATSAQSVERVDPLEADLPANWAPSPCPDQHSAGLPNCASSGSGLVTVPILEITEVMANAVDEDCGEFVEIVNLGAAAVDLAGYLISDGDAADPLEGFGGGPTVVPAGGYAVVLDRSYTGTPYTIPGGAVLLTTDDLSIGSGLAVDDPVTLLAPDGVTVLSAYSSPFNPGNGFSVERVDAGAWRLRVRAGADAGIDRVVQLEKWLDPADWQSLQVVWTYGYKSTVVEATWGYSYSLPYRLTLAHPCRDYWYTQHSQVVNVPRCVSYGLCTPMVTDWNLFDTALAAWRNAPSPGGGYCFWHNTVEYCFTPAEEVSGVDILNNATYTQLTSHCFTTTLANVILSGRPYASIAAYDATSGVGSTSLWDLLVCYVRSGDWPPSAAGTVARVLQEIPGNEYQVVFLQDN